MLTACTDPADPLPQPQLVIEGWINAGQGPCILLSSSAVVDGNPGPLGDIIARWAKVTITDGQTEEVLYGTSAPQIGFPYYVYRSDTFIGQPGETYTITASYGGKTATATCRTPSVTVKIDTAYISPTSAIVIKFTPTAPDTHIIALAGHQRLLPLPGGIFTATHPGAQQTLSLPLPLADSIPATIALATVTEEVCRFWTAFTQTTLTGSSSFLGQAPALPTNIQGGLGIFSAQTIHSLSLPLSP